MNIAVIAANGLSGQAFVHQALSAGHTVRAGVFNSNPFKPHPKLTVLHCDATNSLEVEALLKNQDAVVSLIGHRKGSPPNVQSDAISVILSSMEKMNVRRLVSLTGTGARFPGDVVTPVDRLLNNAVKFVDPDRIQDGVQHTEIIKNSSTDWTIMRVLKLTNSKPKPYLLRSHGPTKLLTSRHEVASAILAVLEQNTFIHKAPIIG